MLYKFIMLNSQKNQKKIISMDIIIKYDFRKRTGEDNVTVMEEDLRLCSVKPFVEGERRFCFEVLSPLK